MAKYQKYVEYKDLDEDFLPILPIDWQIHRVKTILKLRRVIVGSDSKFYQLLSLSLKGVIPRDISGGDGKIPESFDTYQVVKENDLVFCLFDMDETPRTVGLAPQNGMITGAYNVYEAIEGNVPKFVYYYFLYLDLFKGLKPFYTGLRKVVRSDTFANIKMLCPSFYEQTQIANFLDHETAKIDSLIEKQQKLIELLKEKRQAVISHAVTKGLNPNVLMKDSGVEWLGQVPEHWEVSRFKFVCSSIIAGPFGSSITKDMYVSKGYKVYGQEQVIPNDFEIGDYYISEKNYLELSRYEVYPKDILISCVGTFGKIAVFPENAQKGIINPRLIKATVSNKFNPYFFREYLKSDAVFKQFEQLSRGGTMGVINIGILNEIFAVIPPRTEQDNIYNFIQQQKNKFNHLIQKAESTIQLMQERRTALISSAVTGKIDVRNWKNPNNNEANTEFGV
ncbi:restriction endonuclease subunit S [Acinetobacter sp. WCHAc060033]|uniref:restriction endonuclease subunit S n=1 Tax=Acinetobacter sp. WCHAc060033 TaxID=2518624 RepID=UPI0013EE6E54|nr:restriction endonuclease subunit S [Acinetobacter sp. WCHAc060033]